MLPRGALCFVTVESLDIRFRLLFDVILLKHLRLLVHRALTARLGFPRLGFPRLLRLC